MTLMDVNALMDATTLMNAMVLMDVMALMDAMACIPVVVSGPQVKNECRGCIAQGSAMIKPLWPSIRNGVGQWQGGQ